mgnify:FL=1
MQVGDLVTYWYQRPRWSKGESVHVGLVVESAVHAADRAGDVKVLWTGHQEPISEAIQHLSLIDDSLTT